MGWVLFIVLINHNSIFFIVIRIWIRDLLFPRLSLQVVSISLCLQIKKEKDLTAMVNQHVGGTRPWFVLEIVILFMAFKHFMVWWEYVIEHSISASLKYGVLSNLWHQVVLVCMKTSFLNFFYAFILIFIWTYLGLLLPLFAQLFTIPAFCNSLYCRL